MLTSVSKSVMSANKLETKKPKNHCLKIDPTHFKIKMSNRVRELLGMKLCSSRKYPYSPHRRDWNFLGGGGFCNAKKFKEMYEA